MCMYSTDHYLVNEGTVTSDDLLITIDGSLSMTLNATLYNNSNLSEVKCSLWLYVYDKYSLVHVIMV